MAEMEIFWFDQINGGFIDFVIPAIADIVKEEKDKEIVLWINSVGGSFESAIIFLDFIKARKVNLTTIGIGQVSSAAVLVWACGRKRKAARHCRFLFHKPRQVIGDEGEVFVSCADCEELARDLKKANRKLCRLLARLLKVKMEKILPLTEGVWLTARDAKKMGMVHQII